MFQSGRKILHERGRGFFVLPNVFGFIFIVFAVLLRRAVLPLSYIQHIKRRKQVLVPYLGYVRTYRMLDGAWSFWHLEIACLHLIVWTVCFVPLFFLVRKRA